jgi:hypothetical protein
MSLSTRATPARGSYDIDKINAFQRHTVSDLSGLTTATNRLTVIVDSLAAGGADTRWNLRKEIDVHTYGIDGSTVFVFNEASSAVADGYYWDATEKRPLTIAEIIEDYRGRINVLEAASSDSSTSFPTDLNDLWTAVGWAYDSTSGKASGSASLDYRTGTLETNVDHLASDVYGDARTASGVDPGWTGWSWGQSSFSYGINEYLHYLAVLHGVNPKSAESPWDVDHDSGSVVTLPIDQDEVTSTGYTSADRLAVWVNTLEFDMKRIRYEVEYTRGVSFASGNINGPFVTDYPTSSDREQTLYSHINFTDNNPSIVTASQYNPHAVSYKRTGAEALFTTTRSFTGQSSETDGSPTYSTWTGGSLQYLTDGDSLEKSAGLLDAAISTQVVRQEAYVARGGTEFWRETNAITVTHNQGKKPVVNVLDLAPESEDAYGMYASWTRDANVVHQDDNELEVWTGSEEVLIIMIF